MKTVLLVIAIFFTPSAIAQIAHIDIETIPHRERRGLETLTGNVSSYLLTAIDVATLINTLGDDPTLLYNVTLHYRDQNITLTLNPHDLRSLGYHTLAANKSNAHYPASTQARWYKGYINNDPRNIARLTITPRGIDALLYINGKPTIIEPLKNYTTTASVTEHVIYEAANLHDNTGLCLSPHDAAQRISSTVGRTAATTADEQPRVIQIATEATHSFYERYGKDTNDRILAILNEVEGVYERDFGITFRVTFQHYFEDDTDPYTGDGQELLSQFQNYWNSHWPDVPRHLAFLFNGVLLNSGILGRAYEGQACADVGSGYGYISFSFSTYESAATAHEIGHLFNAVHETGDACSVSHTIMCNSFLVGAPFEFSEIAKGDIRSFLAAHDCFDAPLQATVYPVPAGTVINIEASEPEFAVTLYNRVGEQVFYGTYPHYSGTVSVEGLTNGIYLARIVAGKKTVSRRVEVIR